MSTFLLYFESRSKRNLLYAAQLSDFANYFVKSIYLLFPRRAAFPPSFTFASHVFRCERRYPLFVFQQINCCFQCNSNTAFSRYPSRCVYSCVYVHVIAIRLSPNRLRPPPVTTVCWFLLDSQKSTVILFCSAAALSGELVINYLLSLRAQNGSAREVHRD